MTTAIHTDTYSFMGELVRILVPAERTGNAVAMLEHVAPRGMATPLHVQPNEDEAFFIVDGRISLFVDGERSEAGAGEVVWIPRGVPHAFRVDSEQARIIALSVPGNHERFFRLAGDPVDAETQAPDFGRMAAAAAEAGFELLGPPPFDA
jgi:quercetin dioxygenase-like cupin family protein